MLDEIHFQPPIPPLNFPGPPLPDSTADNVDIQQLAQTASYIFKLERFITFGPVTTAGENQGEGLPFTHLAEAMLHHTRIAAHVLHKRHPNDPIFGTPTVSNPPDLQTLVTEGFAGIKTQLADIDTKVTALDNNVKALGTKVGLLENKVGSLQTETRQLRADVNNVNAASAGVAARVETLAVTLSQNEATVKDVVKQLSSLPATEGFKTAVGEAISNSMVEIRESNQSNASRLDDIQATITTLRDEFGTLQRTTEGVHVSVENTREISTDNTQALGRIQSNLSLVDRVQRQMINEGRQASGDWLEIPNSAGSLPTAQAPPLIHVVDNNRLANLTNADLARLLCFYDEVPRDEQETFIRSARPGGWHTSERVDRINRLRQLLVVPGSFF